MFPAALLIDGHRFPSSGPRHYWTISGRDAVELEYVRTPNGPVLVVDGRRAVSLDDTHTLMQDMALYRSATDSEGAFQRRRGIEQEVPRCALTF